MAKIKKTVIELKGLIKRYPGAEQDAVHNLSIKINAGEVYGFLGPNGAGKSTTIRLLLDFIKPTGGRASILGLDSQTDSVKIKDLIGYLSGEVALYPKMTGQQFLDYMADLHPLNHPDYLTKLIKTFQADLDVPINSLSKGNRQKIGIIQALMHEPKVLILDEPTGGLDPLMQEAFYKLLKEVKAKGVTTFVSSHNLAEVQKMCDRVGIIKEGLLISESTIADLKRIASQTFDIVFVGKPPLSELRRAFGQKSLQLNGQKVTINISGDINPFFKILSENKVKSLSSRELDLEQEFMHFYGEENK